MIRKLLQTDLVKDNLVLFLGTLILNIFGFLYHFYMGRALGPEHYGALGAALSILYIMNVPLNTVQTGIANFASVYKVQGELGKLKYLFFKSLKRLILFGILGLIIFLALTPFISRFLHLELSTLFVLSSFMILTLLLPLVRGVLQGIQDFKNLSINLVVEGLLKFSIGIILVIFGYKVNGAIGALVVSYVVAFLIGLKPLHKLLKQPSIKTNTKEVYKYTMPVLLMLLSLTIFYSIDIILVKHFFSDVDAGYYSAISLIGKIIFFGSLSISQVMFPKSAELYQSGKATKPLLYKSLGIISLFVIPAILIYFFIPRFIVNLLYGSAYLPIVPFIGWFGLFIGLVSFVYLISFYQISIHKRKFLFVLFFFNILEIAGIWFFHASLFQVIQVLFIITFLLLLVLIIEVIISKDGKTQHRHSSV